MVDPIGGAPLFLTLTEGASEKERKLIALRASLTLFIVLALFLFLGQNLLKLFHISLSAFKVAGGLLLILTAIDMLYARTRAIKETPEEREKWKERLSSSLRATSLGFLERRAQKPW